MAYPIASGYFPGRGELPEQLGAITGSGYYLGLHFYAGFGPSAEREIMDRLRERDVKTLTPIECMTQLFELTTLAKKDT